MKWSMDTHKFMSEITRKALQIMVAHGVTSESEPEVVEATENELADAGIYRSREGVKGRIRRALFTYFKAYGCMDDNERLTEIGKLFAENKKYSRSSGSVFLFFTSLLIFIYSYVIHLFSCIFSLKLFCDLFIKC